MAQKNLKKLSDAGVKIGFGTDTGPPGRFQGYGEHWEMELMVQAGLTPRQVITAASKTSAEFLGAKDLGTIERGHWADLLVLGANPLDDIRNTRKIERSTSPATRFDNRYRDCPGSPQKERHLPARGLRHRHLVYRADPAPLQIRDPAIHHGLIRRLYRIGHPGEEAEAIQLGPAQPVVRQQFNPPQPRQFAHHGRDAVQVLFARVVFRDHRAPQQDIGAAGMQPAQVGENLFVRLPDEGLVKLRIGLLVVVQEKIDVGSHGFIASHSAKPEVSMAQWIRSSFRRARQGLRELRLEHRLTAGMVMPPPDAG